MSVNSLLTLSVVEGGWVWQTNPVRSCLIFPRYFVVTRWKSRDITLPTKVCSQNYSFSSSHVWMSELDYKESWASKNWSFQTVVLEKTLESPLDCEEIQLVHPKGNQSWIFTGRTDAEAETPIFGHLMRRTNSFEKTLILGKIEGGRRRGWQRISW